MWGGNNQKIMRTAKYTAAKSMTMPVSKYSINLTKEPRGLISICRQRFSHHTSAMHSSNIENTGREMFFIYP